MLLLLLFSCCVKAMLVDMKADKQRLELKLDDSSDTQKKLNATFEQVSFVRFFFKKNDNVVLRCFFLKKKSIFNSSFMLNHCKSIMMMLSIFIFYNCRNNKQHCLSSAQSCTNCKIASVTKIINNFFLCAHVYMCLLKNFAFQI